MKSPLINVLTRTSDGRKELFRRCIDSISSQSYPNIRVIVCADTDQSHADAAEVLQFCKKQWDLIRVQPQKEKPNYWNLYCNDLKAVVQQGWFFFCDSDDFLCDNTCVKRLVGHLPQNQNGVICRFLRKGSPKPTSFYFNRRIIRLGHIGGSCIVLQAHHRDLAMWQAKRAADYTFITEMSKKIKLTWVKTSLVHADNSGLKGRNPQKITA